MPTVTISDKNYQSLVKKANTLKTSPEMVINKLLETFLTTVNPTSQLVEQTQPPLSPIKTLGDLLDYGYGLWANRGDIEDSILYATELRQKAWQRNL